MIRIVATRIGTSTSHDGLSEYSRGSLDVPGASNQADVGEKWPPAQRILDEFMISVWDEAHEFLYGTKPTYSVVFCLGRSP